MPGVRAVSERKSRPMIGRFSICWLVTDVVRPVFSGSTIGAVAVTVIASETDGVSFRSVLVVLPRSTTTFGTWAPPSPESSPATL